MKPALLYLKKYIQQNYNGDRYQDSDKKNQKQNEFAKNSEDSIFKQKKKYQWQNRNKKEFYFKVPKSFNASKIQKKMNQSDQKTYQNGNTIQTLLIERNNTAKNTKLSQLKINSNNDDLIQNEYDRYRDEIQKTQKIDSLIEKQVKLIISPPKEKESTFPQSQQIFQQFQQNYNVQTQKNQKSKHYVLHGQIGNKQKKNDRTKTDCKSMNKIGYQNISQYLEQMKKYHKINKKEIKEACYYPLECMKPSTPTAESYERDSKIIRNQVQRKIEKFSKLIEVYENFTFNVIENQFRNKLPQYKLKRQKSNFSKNKKKNEESFNEKGKKSLQQYEKMVLCNCSNKRFFTYQLSQDTQYNSFLKLNTSLLQTAPTKENNYLIRNQENIDFIGLHFCCLINSNQNEKQTFFWISKPIQFYRKEQIINAIDNFLFQMNSTSVIQSQKIWIVDFHGRNSFITKKMLKKCNQIKPQKKNLLPQQAKARISKRMSLSQQLAEYDLADSLLNLMSNSSDYKQTGFVKKQRNNISTIGDFQMVYQSKEKLK